jgi:uroporphyrinogen decarboxylase
MIERYSHRERLQMIMAGERPDRAAASIWRHFYHREAAAEGLAEAMLAFQREFDWDFMKINPRASYHVEDWGCRLEWSSDEFKKHRKLSFTVDDLEDWDKIEVLPPTAPVLAEHLKAISLIKKKSDPELPLLMTIFNPIGIARYLVGSTEKLKDHLRQDETKIVAAIERITETFEKYVAECLNAGNDGIFFATLEWASADVMTYEQYAAICRPFDLRILKAAAEAPFNMLHVCGSNNYLKELTDYPVPMINWESANPTNINLDDSFGLLGDKVAAAGLDDKGWLWHSTPEEVGHEVERIRDGTMGRRFIFAPGCAVDPQIPYENFKAVRDNL